ncbi:MAG: hypothetical protein DRO13_05040 [Thermoprotei archaeon]|nr:MAG: hypothetical protein DRO13_05040 [Thermoprotei archaeon]
MLKLLISVKHAGEVGEALYGGADIIDIKDPSRGSLGLPDLELVEEALSRVRNWSTGSVETSIALGDVDRYGPELKYVAFTAAKLGVDYVKIGLATPSMEEALRISREASKIIKRSKKTKLVLVGYADHASVGFIEPLKVIDIAIEAGAGVVMIDTFTKKGKSTYDLLGLEYLRNFVEKARRKKLMTALAGSLKKEHMRITAKLGFNVVGVRGAACIGGRNGSISRRLVTELKEEIISFR